MGGLSNRYNRFCAYGLQKSGLRSCNFKDFKKEPFLVFTFFSEKVAYNSNSAFGLYDSLNPALFYIYIYK